MSPTPRKAPAPSLIVALSGFSRVQRATVSAAVSGRPEGDGGRTSDFDGSTPGGLAEVGAGALGSHSEIRSSPAGAPGLVDPAFGAAHSDIRSSFWAVLTLPR